MKGKIALLAAMIFVASFSYGACSNACSSSQYTCSLTTSGMTKGSSGTLTASVTNQQSQSQSGVTATILGSWFSGETTSQVISSMSSGESKSLDFTITPNSAGSNDVCIDMGGTCTADCGQITINSAAELNVVSLTSSDSDNSVSTGSSFTISTTIQNTGTETAGSSGSITATLADSNGKCTITGATKTIGAIAGSASSSQSWSVSAGSSAGTCAFTMTATGTPGGTGSSTLSVAITTTTTTTIASSSSSSSSSGGGGLVFAAKPAGTTVSTTGDVVKITMPSLSAEVAAGVDIPNPGESGVTRIAFIPTASVANVTISIKKIAAPAVTAPDGVYGYMEISLVNISDANIKTAEINFRVLKEWLTSGGYSFDEIYMSRYADGWKKLITNDTGSNETYINYVAQTPGFSTFAISAAKPANNAAPAKNEAVANQAGGQVKPIWETYGWYISLAALTIALIMGWMYYHGHQRKKEARYEFQKK